jgi:hypothetical protein
LKKEYPSIDYSLLRTSPNFDFQAELIKTMASEIQEEIDAELLSAIMGTPSARYVRNLISKELRMLNNYSPTIKSMPHRLSWRKQLGGQIDGWEAKLRRFYPVGTWSHSLTRGSNDATFHFEEEDDKFNFLMLMR